MAGTLAIPQRAVTNTSVALDFSAVHTSTAKAKRMEAANLQAAGCSPDTKHQQAQAITQPAATGTPALLATAAASGTPQLLSRQAIQDLGSIPGPVWLCQEAAGAVADIPHGAEEAGRHQQGTGAVSKANLAGQEGQQTMQVVADEVMAEATEAADQLPLSYPATLVATLPCTAPAWLAQSQRTAVTNVPPTQLVPTQAAHSIVTVRLPVVASNGLTPLTSTGRVLPQGTSAAVQERPKGRSVSRLNQLSGSVPECEPSQAVAGSLPLLSRQGGQQHHATPPAYAKEAAVMMEAGPRHATLPKLTSTTSRAGSAAPDSVPVPEPDEARAMECSLGGQVVERGKRAAECSPGAYDIEKGTRKRARSDSPTRKPYWQKAGMTAAEHKGPSDADVQVRTACSTSNHVVMADCGVDSWPASAQAASTLCHWLLCRVSLPNEPTHFRPYVVEISVLHWISLWLTCAEPMKIRTAPAGRRCVGTVSCEVEHQVTVQLQGM